MREAVGGADDHDLLADPHRVGVTDPRHLHRRRHALELQERDVGVRIGRHECRTHDLTGDALDGDLVHGVDDVGGRHHPAAAGDQETGARFLEAGDPSDVDVAPLGPYDEHGRVDLAEDVVQVLGLGRRGKGRQYGCREYQCEDRLHGHLCVDRHYVAPEDRPNEMPRQASERAVSERAVPKMASRLARRKPLRKHFPWIRSSTWGSAGRGRPARPRAPAPEAATTTGRGTRRRRTPGSAR